MSSIEKIGQTIYQVLVKDPASYWLNKKESEVTLKDAAKVYFPAATWPLWILFTTPGCGVENEGQQMPDGSTDEGVNVNITPDVSGDGIYTAETDAGPVIVAQNEFLIDDLGNKVQGSGEIAVGPVSFIFNEAKDKTVKVVIESVPEYILTKYGKEGLPEIPDNVKQELFKLDGLFDMSPVTYHPSESQINIGTKEDPYYIKDPRKYRVPVYVGDVRLNDLTGKLNDPATLCKANNLPEKACRADKDNQNLFTMVVSSADQIYTNPDSACRLGADKAENSDPYKPYVLFIPKEAYNNNEGKFESSFVLRVDTNNYTQEHNYALAVRIRLVIE